MGNAKQDICSTSTCELEDFVHQFWNELATDKMVKSIVSTKWEHFVDGGPAPLTPKKFKAFGGTWWEVIPFSDTKEAYTTDNLWHQGTIPECMRHLFQINAYVRQLIKEDST